MATEKDIVLIYFEDRPLTFARIEKILPDAKPGWHHVQLLMLQVPLQSVTWILRDAYIDGNPFTMNGKQMRLELVEAPKAALVPDDDTENAAHEQEAPAPPPKQGNVITLKALKDRQS